ncbi:gp58-like family protein [Liquorilactobacillus satsumensis]|uniref:Peptidase S74 domain-containing protein n=1 Tax=Liquorilactobacillus satsumensis DSM 16230 = JCM 12392 TaxID=1423801 RepID=A0A0R1V2J5_9LACO|nr:gp58-like family protein [Liquorilactobacillus satsumensis]KRL97432.1 hypothetical protein FD50_GL001413 [Liquorilactobacillus satsumensis DSM 16230 = JCM 12392]
MITQSDKALEAWRATERVLDAIVTINGTDYHTTDITSIAYDSGAFTGDTFAIGSTYENGLTIEFSHIVEGLEQGQKVTAKVGIKTSDGTYEYCPLGVFIVSDDIEMDRNNDQTSIKCYDQMCLMEGTYTSKLSYPASAADIIAEIANMAGVMLNTDEIARLPTVTSLANAISGQTYRDAIGWIAQFYAGFATFDRDGKLTIHTVATPDYTLDPSQYEQAGLTKNEAPYKIGGIQCEVTTTTTDSTGESTDNTVTLQVGDSTGSQIKLTNNLMTQERLEMVWAQLKDINFYPYSLNWFGNPAIEAGDWLTLQDTKGNKFNVPNNSYTMTFDGSFSAVSKADQTSTSSSTYAWNGQLTQVVKTLVGKLTPAGNFIYGPETTDEPTGAKFNDLWYKQNGNKLEMWTYERQSDGSGKWSQTLSDATGEDVKSAVAANQAEAEVAKTNSQNAVDKADSAIQQAVSAYTLGSNANQLASDAKNDAATALTKIGQTDNNLTNVQTQLTDAKSDLSAVTQKAKENGDSIIVVQSDISGFKNQLADTDGRVSSTEQDINGIKTAVTNSKNDITVLQTTATGLTANMQDAQGNIASLQATAQNITQTVSDTNTRIDNLDYANTNLLTNSGTFKATWGYFGSIDTSSPTIFHYSGTVDNYQDFLNQPNLAGLSSIQQTYTIGFWAKGTGILTTYVYPGVGGGDNHHTWSLTSEWQYFTQNFDTHASDTDMGNKTFLFRNNKGDNPSGSLDVYITKPKLEQGSKATPWSPAPQDFTDLSTIVTGHTTQIEQNTNLINLKANSTDVDQLAGRVSTAEGNISVMTGQIQTKVTQNDINNALTGYATQDWTSGQISVKANEINSTVSQVQTNLDNLQIGGRNIIPNSSMSVLENTGWAFNPATARIEGTDTVIDVLTGTMSAEISRDITGVQPNTDYCISIDLDWGEYDSSKVGSFEAHVFFVERKSDGSTTATYVDNNYNISNSDPRQGHTFKTQPDTAGGTLIVRAGPYNKIMFKELEMQTGTKFGPWSPAPADLATVTALSSVSQKADSISTTVTNNKSDADSKFSTINQTISGIQSTVSNKADNSTVTQLSNVVQTKVSSQDYTSKVTQLSDDINLRVEKSGVIAAIDVSSEGIQIYGDKLHITASTYIDNAVIKSAMIDTLSADKITVGTLNGASVNVINLNAANITTGTLSGSNLSLNLDTGEVLFQKGAIKSTDGLLNIEINDGTFSQNNSNGDGFIFRNGNIYFSNKSSWAAWDAPLYGTISLNERAFAAGQGGMAIKGAKNVVVQTDDYNGDFVMGPPASLTGSGLLLREDRIEMASAQTYLYGGLGYSYINHPFIEIGTSIWENQYNDNAGSNVLIRASGIILDGNVMSLNGFHIANNYITTAGDGLWVNSAFGSGGNAAIHAQSFNQTSLLSKKTNVIPLDRLKARNAIRTVDIQEYMYKDDVENGITKKYSSGIIDDINDKPKYSMPFDWISADGKGREDGTALGYTIVAVQDLYDQIEDLKEQVKQLKGESAA